MIHRLFCRSILPMMVASRLRDEKNNNKQTNVNDSPSAENHQSKRFPLNTWPCLGKWQCVCCEAKWEEDGYAELKKERQHVKGIDRRGGEMERWYWFFVVCDILLTLFSSNNSFVQYCYVLFECRVKRWFNGRDSSTEVVRRCYWTRRRAVAELLVDMLLERFE